MNGCKDDGSLDQGKSLDRMSIDSNVVFFFETYCCSCKCPIIHLTCSSDVRGINPDPQGAQYQEHRERCDYDNQSGMINAVFRC